VPSGNVDVVHRGFRAFVDGDVAGLAALLDERVQWRGIDYGPWDATDREQVMRVLVERLAEGWRVELEECIEAGDRVVVCLREAGMEPARRIEDAGGRTFAVDRFFTIARYFAVVTIRDGRVAKVEDFPDRAAALEAAGIAAA
jgi:ketosteroid isomerase-like protein